MFSDSCRDLLASGPSSHEKHLDKFFKFCHTGFWWLDLATCSQLIPVAKNVWRVTFRAVFKNFSFFPHISWLFIVLFIPPSAKITISTHKTSILFIISSPIFKKRYGFCLFLNVFHVSSPRLLGLCVCVKIWKYDDWIWSTDVLLSLLYRFCWLCVLTFCLGCTWCHLLHTHTLWHA